MDSESYEHGYHRNFRMVHQRNAALHMGTYSLLPSDQFLRSLDATHTLYQDSWMLTLDDKHLQILNELRGKLQDIMMAVKAIVAACKKGRCGTADGMGGEWFSLELVCSSQKNRKNSYFLRPDGPSEQNLKIFANAWGNPNTLGKFLENLSEHIDRNFGILFQASPIMVLV